MKSGQGLLSRLGILFLCLLIITTGAICSKSGTMPKTVALKYWRAEDDLGSIRKIISEYQATYPYVQIDLQIIPAEDYESRMLDGWVKGEGPDIISIPNDWMGKYKEYITPMPASVKLSEVSVTERLGKKEVAIAEKKYNSLSLQELENHFVDGVAPDLIFLDSVDGSNKIYGLALAVDSLALYYNKNLLNQAQIITPPKDWLEFKLAVEKTRAINVDNQIVRAGAALGTYENIPDAPDILALLMMQNGTRMEQNRQVSFNNESTVKPGYFTGEEALDFYASFASAGRETYTWNDTLPDALAQFIQGNLAFYIGYHSRLKEIRDQAPNLNFDFTTIPQVNPTERVNFAKYWVESVASNSQNSDIAWHFVQFLTAETQAQKYLDATIQPAARRNLLNQQTEIYDIKPWVEQALTARSWYHGRKPEVVETVYADMIGAANLGNQTLAEILNTGANKINLTY